MFPFIFGRMPGITPGDLIMLEMAGGCRKVAVGFTSGRSVPQGSFICLARARQTRSRAGVGQHEPQGSSSEAGSVF